MISRAKQVECTRSHKGNACPFYMALCPVVMPSRPTPLPPRIVEGKWAFSWLPIHLSAFKAATHTHAHRDAVMHMPCSQRSHQPLR